MALCPFAVKKLIPAGANDPRLDVVHGAIAHVAVSNATSLHDFFDGPSGGIESHFYIRLDGVLEQYRDTQYEADANYQANSFRRSDGKRGGFVSIETAGMGDGKWNPAQLKTLKRLLAWLAGAHDFPLAPCTGPFGKGVGYHTMWGSPSEWTPVAKSCPGPQRIAQFKTDLVPWMREVTNPSQPPAQPVKKGSRIAQAAELLEEARDLLKAAREDGRKRLGDNIASIDDDLDDLPAA